MGNQDEQHIEQLESGVSEVPVTATESFVSPYPRIGQESVRTAAPLYRRVIWDLGIALYGFAAMAALCQFPASRVGTLGWHYGVLGMTAIIAILIGHVRTEVKAWHGFVTLFWGASLASILFSRPAPIFDSINTQSGTYPFVFSLVFCVLGSVVLGSATHFLVPRSQQKTDAYEGIRQAWGLTFFLLLFVGSSIGYVYSNLLTSERSLWIPWLLSGGTVLLMLPLWIARSRHRASVIAHLAMLWIPAVFSTPVVLACIAHKITIESISLDPSWQTFLIFAVIQMIAPFAFRVKLTPDRTGSSS